MIDHAGPARLFEHGHTNTRLRQDKNKQSHSEGNGMVRILKSEKNEQSSTHSQAAARALLHFAVLRSEENEGHVIKERSGQSDEIGSTRGEGGVHAKSGRSSSENSKATSRPTSTEMVSALPSTSSCWKRNC